MTLAAAPIPFYLVWSPTGTTPPQHRHLDGRSAQAEAWRLASKNPGHEFYVVAPMARTIIEPTVTHFCDSDIPF